MKDNYIPPCEIDEEDFSCDGCMEFDFCKYSNPQADCEDCKLMYRLLNELPPCETCPIKERRKNYERKTVTQVQSTT